MDNRPYLDVFDATKRRYSRDMTFEQATAIVAHNIGAGVYRDAPQTVAAGIYQRDPGATVYFLSCEEWPGGYKCWYGYPGFLLNGAIGTTPAEAIERAQALCVGR